MREAAALGIGGIYIRDDVGGSALTRFDAALIFEALAQGCPTVSAFISIHNMASWMIDAYGSDTQRQKWLPPTLHDGSDRKLLRSPSRARLGCCRRLRTRAVRDGDHYVLNGQKQFLFPEARAGAIYIAQWCVPAATGRAAFPPW